MTSLHSSDLYTDLVLLADPSTADEKKYAIYISTSGDNFTQLPGNMTLEQVNDRYWKLNKPLEMYYSLHKKLADSPNKKTGK